MSANQSTRKSPVSHSPFKYEDGVVSFIASNNGERGTVAQLDKPEIQNLLGLIAKQVEAVKSEFVERAPAQVLAAIDAVKGIAGKVEHKATPEVVTLTAVTAVSPNNEIDGGRSA
jgi:hypothetical protein